MRIMRTRAVLSLSAIAALLLAGTSLPPVANAAAGDIAVTSEGWDVIGLDSNNVAVGPNQFEQSFKVCNTTASASSSIDVTFAWTTSNSLINLDGPATKTINPLAAGACQKVWWSVTITRDAAAYDTARSYTVTATDTVSPGNSGSYSKFVYVEHLVSQARNVVDAFNGPASALVGDVVSFTFSGHTATNGYEQVVMAAVLSSTIFEIQSVTGTFTVGGSVTNFYKDACGWDPAGTSKLNWGCLSVGKAGGNPMSITVTAKVASAGSASLVPMIYDYSGSSFHYNSNPAVHLFTAYAPVLASSAPIANPDVDTTPVNTPIEVAVLTNDQASDGNTLDPSTVAEITPPAHGSISIDPSTGKITYTPATDYVGTDTFTYEVCDTSLQCVQTTVTITIEAPIVVAPPVATDDNDSTPVNTPKEIDVLANDLPGAGYTLDPTCVTVLVAPSHGTVAVDAVTGKITYTPNDGYTGTDTFEYRVCETEDPTLHADATVTITITDAAPAPVLTALPLTSGKTEWGFAAAIALPALLLGAALVAIRRRRLKAVSE